MIKMQRIALSVAMCLVASAGMRAHGQEKPRKVRLFVAGEVLLPMNAGDGLKDAAERRAQVLSTTGGYESASFESDSSLGGGIRVGLLAPAPRGIEVGGSLGYLRGPVTTTEVQGRSAFLGNGLETREKKSDYLRVLAEAKREFNLRGPWSLGIGAGLGVAFGNTFERSNASGSLNRAPSNDAQSWNGFTWEISPSASYRAGAWDVNVGLRYAVMPTFSATPALREGAWDSLGFFVGTTF